MNNEKAIREIGRCRDTLYISSDIAGHVGAIASSLGIGVVDACNEFVGIVGATCAYLVAESGEVEEGDDEDDGAAGR